MYRLLSSGKFIFTVSSVLLLLQTGSIKAQRPVLIHSHNDYHQTVPFYQAYAQQLDSYEADVFFDSITNQLMVAHEQSEITTGNTLEDLYITPIVKLFAKNNGKAWKKSDKSFYLMIDIKRDYKKVIPAILKLLYQHPEVFNRKLNANAPVIVLTGLIPSPDEFASYPPDLMFDGRPQYQYSPEQLQRVAFISDSFAKYSVWNGKGSIKPSEKARLEAIVKEVHAKGKMIRFWGSPDNLNTWQTFRFMGIDIINTDKPEKCAGFFNNEEKSNFSFSTLPQQNSLSGFVTTDKLDKTTKDFKGFNKSITLEKPIATYTPTYKNDGKKVTPRNIILLIGDGMGLTQLSAADLVNGGLSISKMMYCGFQRTQPRGSYITDSAGAGSALATGVKSNNRHISSDEAGNPHTSLTEIMISKGKLCGIVTNGNIADATPAAFYAHATERDDSDLITSWLLRTKLNFLAGSGEDVILNRKDNLNLKSELMKRYNYSNSLKKDLTPYKPAIIIDESLGKAATNETLQLLAITTTKAIKHLENKQGFFLVVEGAKIDYAGHANSFPNSIIETLAFDLAVQEALKFADTNGETLVIVTGDHETGGLSIIDGNAEQGRITGVYSSDDHTPVFLPVFAYGPGAGAFIGTYNNTDIFRLLTKLL